MVKAKKISVVFTVLLIISFSQAYVGEGEIVLDNEVEVEIAGASEDCGVDGLGSITLEGEIINTGMTSTVESWFALAEPETIEEINYDIRSEGYFTAEVDVDVTEDDTVTAGILAENDADQEDSDYISYQANCETEFVEQCEGNPSFSGCVRPLIFDPHPHDSRDTIATHAFDESGDHTSFSTLFGSSIFIQEGSIVGSSEASGDTIEQPWINPEGWDYPWAAGDFTFDEASTSEGWTYDEEREYPHHTEGEVEGEEHYTYPDPDRYDYDEGYEETPEEYCANAVLDEEKEDAQFECPEDYGLADNIPEDEEGTRSVEPETISDSHSSMDALDLPGTFDQISQIAGSTSANPDMSSYDMEAEEWNDHRNDDWTSGQYTEQDDLTSAADSEDSATGPITGSGSTNIIYSPETYTGVPDYYLESNPNKQFHAVYAEEVSTNNIGSFTSYWVDTDWAGAYTGGSESGYLDCTGENCSSSGSISGCESRTSDTVTEYYFDSSDESTFTSSGDSREIWTEDDGSYGYEQHEDFNSWSVDIDYWGSYSSRQVTVDNKDCTNYESGTTYTCSGIGGCSRSDHTTVYHWDDQDTEYYGTTGTTTFSFEYEELDFKEEAIFNVDSARNEHGDEPIEVLFEDWRYANSNLIERAGFGGHYSVQVDDEPQHNNPSISSSEFVIRAGESDGTPDEDGDHFISERVDFGTANVDGVFGESNGMIAYASSPGESGEMGNNELFADREVAAGSMNEGFISPDDISGEGCGSYYCVNRVHLTLENLDNWGNPMDPSTGIEYEVTQNQGVEESYSVCRLYQELHEGGPEDTHLRCQFDHAEQYPGGPTYSRSQPVYPDDFQ